MKKLFNLLQHLTPVFEYVGNMNQIHWSSWTAPADGVIIMDIGWLTSGSGGYYYVNDTTANRPVAKMTTYSANGTSETRCFPVIKGHTYKVSGQFNADGNHLTFSFYKLKLFGGGYGITSFMSTVLSAISSFVRRWSHEVRNGFVKENTSGGYILKSCDASCKRSKFGNNRHRYTEWSNGQSREFGNNTKWELGAQCNWCIQCHNCNNSLPKHIKFINERNIRGSGVLHDIALISERGCSYV